MLTPQSPTLWHRRVGGLPRPFWYLWTGSLVNRMGSFVAPFLALYLTRERGASIAEAGLVLTALGLGSALSQPVGGVMADRLGRRTTMVFGMAAAAAALGLLAAARSFPALCLATFLYGMLLDLYRPASQAAVADLVSERDRPRAFALNFWAINLGFSVALPLGGFLADRGYGLLFFLDAVTCLAMAALILRGVPETRPERKAGESAGAMSQVLRDRLMMALVLGSVMQAVVYMQVFSTLPLVIAADGLGTRGYGIAAAMNGLLIVCVQPLLLGLVDAVRRDQLLLAAALLLGLGFGLTTFADTLMQHIGVITIWTLGEVLAAGLLSSLVATIAPVRMRGRYMGVFGMSFGIAAFLAPLLGTQVLDHLGESWLWGGSAVLVVGSGIVLAAVSRAATRRVSAVDPSAG